MPTNLIWCRHHHYPTVFQSLTMHPTPHFHWKLLAAHEPPPVGKREEGIVQDVVVSIISFAQLDTMGFECGGETGAFSPQLHGSNHPPAS